MLHDIFWILVLDLVEFEIRCDLDATYPPMTLSDDTMIISIVLTVEKDILTWQWKCTNKRQMKWYYLIIQGQLNVLSTPLTWKPTTQLKATLIWLQIHSFAVFA